jgi:hypothetical protein
LYGSGYVFFYSKQNTDNLRELAKTSVLQQKKSKQNSEKSVLKQKSSVAEPHHLYAAPAALAPAPTLMYSKATFLKRTKV